MPYHTTDLLSEETSTDLESSSQPLLEDLSEMIATLQNTPSVTSELKEQLVRFSMDDQTHTPMEESLKHRIEKTYQAIQKAQQESNAHQKLTQPTIGAQEQYWNTLYTHKTLRRTR